MTVEPIKPHADAGIASAEDGVVILEGPNGVAVTMTARAAAQTGRSLMDAAQLAEAQLAAKSGHGEG